MTDVHRGCLALADITGYTRYLGGVELEHSHDVMADLLGVVATELAAIGSLAKLEGDAVFVCDREGSTDGETLLAGCDAAYFAFARRRRTIALRSTCTCEACARIPSLDLKLIAHHGSFVEHVVAGSSELVGPDVIVVHRLLKNRVADRTGLSAFALITDACVTDLGLDPHGLELAAHEEQYDDVGAVRGWVRNLAARWQQAEQREPVRVSAEDAYASVTAVCPGSPAQVWDAVIAPDKILAWKAGATEIEMQNPSGARGVGSRTHCVHGRQAFDQEILDWRPFSYFSYRETGPYGPFMWTIELIGATDSATTRVAVRVKQLGGTRQRMVMALGRRRFTHMLKTSLGNLADLLSS
jgi:Protein of unknown function (DUF2652)/Polyketide cyclase / dehydrase and lipid transport